MPEQQSSETRPASKKLWWRVFRIAALALCALVAFILATSHFHLAGYVPNKVEFTIQPTFISSSVIHITTRNLFVFSAACIAVLFGMATYGLGWPWLELWLDRFYDEFLNKPLSTLRGRPTPKDEKKRQPFGDACVKVSPEQFAKLLRIAGKIRAKRKKTDSAIFSRLADDGLLKYQEHHMHNPDDLSIGELKTRQSPVKWLKDKDWDVVYSYFLAGAEFRPGTQKGTLQIFCFVRHNDKGQALPVPDSFKNLSLDQRNQLQRCFEEDQCRLATEVAEWFQALERAAKRRENDAKWAARAAMNAA